MNYEPLYTFAEKHRVPYNELCTALRAALAAPQPEPVAPADAVMAEALRKARKALDGIDATACCDHWANMNSSARRYAIARDARAAVQDIDRVLLAAAPAPAEDFCYCNDDISLQIVSGGAAKEGLYGRVTLLIDGKYVDYVPAESANPAVPMTEEQIRSIYRKTLNQSLREQDTSVVLQFARAVLSAAPAVREPQDERIRWRDAVIKEAESALRTAEQEFADMPTWANVGHAAKKVTHALAVIAALGIGGGGK